MAEQGQKAAEAEEEGEQCSGGRIRARSQSSISLVDSSIAQLADTWRGSCKPI